MSRKARTWISATLLAILLLNYLVIAIPLYRRIGSLETKVKAMMIKQVRSGEVLKNSEDNYIIDIFKRELIALDRRAVIVNCVSATVAIVIISWLLFGLMVHKAGGKR